MERRLEEEKQKARDEDLRRKGERRAMEQMMLNPIPAPVPSASIKTGKELFPDEHIGILDEFPTIQNG